MQTQSASMQTKVCPRCQATLFSDMNICYGCLYDFSYTPKKISLPTLDEASFSGALSPAEPQLLDIEEPQPVASIPAKPHPAMSDMEEPQPATTIPSESQVVSSIPTEPEVAALSIDELRLAPTDLVCVRNAHTDTKTPLGKAFLHTEGLTLELPLIESGIKIDLGSTSLMIGLS